MSALKAFRIWYKVIHLFDALHINHIINLTQFHYFSTISSLKTFLTINILLHVFCVSTLITKKKDKKFCITIQNTKGSVGKSSLILSSHASRYSNSITKSGKVTLCPRKISNVHVNVFPWDSFARWSTNSLNDIKLEMLEGRTHFLPT